MCSQEVVLVGDGRVQRLGDDRRPLAEQCSGAPDAAEPTASTLKPVQLFDLQAKARIWPCLSYVCHGCSTANPRRAVFTSVGREKMEQCQTWTTVYQHHPQVPMFHACQISKQKRSLLATPGFVCTRVVHTAQNTTGHVPPRKFGERRDKFAGFRRVPSARIQLLTLARLSVAVGADHASRRCAKKR